jgi:hypothetical protein
MNEVARPESLPRLIEQAATALAQATTPAEILDARDRANVAYTAAKMADRLGKMRQAHEEIIAACRKAMGDALVIEAQAQCRWADEIDAAQERGELATHSPGNPQIVKKQNDLKQSATSAELGINRQQLFEARIIRDAEQAAPGVVRRTVEERLKAGEAPTRADVKRATRKQAVHEPSQLTASTRAATREEDRQQGADNGVEPRDVRAYLLGHISAAELLADIFEGCAQCENERNTPESKIRAVAQTGAAAAARAVARNGYNLMREVPEEPLP